MFFLRCQNEERVLQFKDILNPFASAARQFQIFYPIQLQQFYVAIKQCRVWSMHFLVILLLHGFLIRHMLMSHCNGRPRGLFLFQFSAIFHLYCAFTYLGPDWWQQGFDTPLGSLYYRQIVPLPVYNMWVYCWPLIGRGDLISNPPPFLYPSSHPCCFPFIRPHSVGLWRSATTANLIKLTTIKIRLNYCKAVHWHPRSILNLKKKALG